MNAENPNSRFETWLDAYAPVLHHVANGFASGSEREDLMQELLLALWKAAPAYRGDSSVSTFVYRVAHNAALSWRRGIANYRRKVERFEALSIPGAAQGAAEAEKESLEALYAAIRRLPPLDRSLLLLQLDGASYAEIAEVHGITEGNVGVRLNRIRNKLSENMKEVAHELR